MSLPNVIIVDDHDIFREGLLSLFSLKKIANVIGQASNGVEFIKMLEIKKPDIVVMDISMPIMDGIMATEIALKKYPDLNILVLSMFGDEEYYYKLINAGVKGFVLKSANKDELINAFQSVANGNSYFSNELLRKIILKFGSNNSKSEFAKEEDIFTRREHEILNLMCSGFSAIEIAEELCLSKKTIEGHRTHLFSKTGTKNSVALVVYAIKNGLVSL